MTIRTVGDREPRTSTSTFTQLLSSEQHPVQMVILASKYPYTVKAPPPTKRPIPKQQHKKVNSEYFLTGQDKTLGCQVMSCYETYLKSWRKTIPLFSFLIFLTGSWCHDGQIHGERIRQKATENCPPPPTPTSLWQMWALTLWLPET